MIECIAKRMAFELDDRCGVLGMIGLFEVDHMDGRVHAMYV